LLHILQQFVFGPARCRDQRQLLLQDGLPGMCQKELVALTGEYGRLPDQAVQIFTQSTPQLIDVGRQRDRATGATMVQQAGIEISTQLARQRLP